jgi:hypothetical protein
MKYERHLKMVFPIVVYVELLRNGNMKYERHLKMVFFLFLVYVKLC